MKNEKWKMLFLSRGIGPPKGQTGMSVLLNDGGFGDRLPE
jgi:hypothetical protein